jgi:hypothetical protein
MDAFLKVVGINAVLLGFAATFGAFMTISAPSSAQWEQLRKQLEAARAKSWLHGQLEAIRQT